MACSINTAGKEATAQSYHQGELKGVDISISYSGYQYLDVDGLPVYSLGAMLNSSVQLENISQRQYKNVEVRSAYRYAEDTSGVRWWLDNQYVEFKVGDLIPGSLRDWTPADMGPGEVSIAFNSLVLPYEALPGKVYLEIEMRHVNQGNNDEAAVFILFPYTKIKVTAP